MATLQTGSTADVDAWSDNELVKVENHKNEARFTFSQIHQYLQYGTYPSDFQKSDKHALWKRLKFFKSADGNLYYVGGDKLAVAISLLPHISFQYCILFWMQQDLTLELWFRNDLWLKILIDRRESSHQSTTHHTWGWIGPLMNISTKQSPYYMLFLQQMRLPIDAEILAQSSTTDDREDNSFEETVGVLLGSRGQAFQKAQVNITKAQKQQKELYDRKHLQKELEVGTKVLFENTAQQQRKGGKMSWSMNSKIWKVMWSVCHYC